MNLLESQIRAIENSDYFNDEWYRNKYREVDYLGIDPAEHYVRLGWRLGRDPSSLFSTQYYLSSYPDLNDLDYCPLIHYLNWGQYEGRQCVSPERQKKSRDFDASIYLENYQIQKDVAFGSRSPSFAPYIRSNVPEQKQEISIIAFYLPQFHPFQENDSWWGKGFTEWTNVSKAIPQFLGHYQPRLPGELGFYDLRLKNVLSRQIELAKEYGVNGFCFHYYWFDGKRLMEGPLEAFLASDEEELNFPFSLCWANENWTRKWDGAESEILIKQSYSRESFVDVFNDIDRYFQDERYIKINGMPIITIYRAEVIPDISYMINLWRSLALERGYPGLYVIVTRAFGFIEFEEIGADAVCEFPPHAVKAKSINRNLSFLNKSYGGSVFDYTDVVDYATKNLDSEHIVSVARNYYPCVMTGWDNVARRPSDGNVFHNASPQKFYSWLESACNWARIHQESGRRLVFINAWNEWAEGTYLEPDRRYGYAYLHAVRTVREQWYKNIELESLCDQYALEPNSIGVLCLHVYYKDLVDDVVRLVETVKTETSLDIAISFTNCYPAPLARRILEAAKPVKAIVVINRGRDVLPFFSLTKCLLDFDYKYGLKLHTKKSLHMNDGDVWRDNLYSSLLSEKAISLVESSFLDEERKVGFIAPKDSLMSNEIEAHLIENKANMEHILTHIGCTNIEIYKPFIAGTMFWFSMNFIRDLDPSRFDSTFFGPELGAIDGDLAHAFERLFTTLGDFYGYQIECFEVENFYNPY